MTKLKHGHAAGRRRTPEYQVWSNMRGRCLTETHPQFENYGGRGITICQRWLDSFRDFLADVGPRPSDKHSLDRYPNNDGNYEPGNVRWATRMEQCRNTRQNRILTLNGEAMTVVEWAERLGWTEDCIRGRIKKGWTDQEALTTPPSMALKPIGLIEFSGVSLPPSGWAKKIGVSSRLLRSRLQRNQSDIARVLSGGDLRSSRQACDEFCDVVCHECGTAYKVVATHAFKARFCSAKCRNRATHRNRPPRRKQVCQ